MTTLTAPSFRISARLNAQAAEDLAVIKSAEKMPVSEILRASLALYRQTMAKNKPAPLSAFGKHIGKHRSAGDGGLSVDYKSEYGAYLEQKYAKQ